MTFTNHINICEKDSFGKSAEYSTWSGAALWPSIFPGSTTTTTAAPVLDFSQTSGQSSGQTSGQSTAASEDESEGNIVLDVCKALGVCTTTTQATTTFKPRLDKGAEDMLQ